ncbi:MAG: hypothetical protein P1U34_10205 [Coxiellaceae bacterium]|nr:hypothetical protein [Coxiellaceae bacterium]
MIHTDAQNTAEGYFKYAHQKFLSAELASGRSIIKYYKISGHAICLRFINIDLVQTLTKALSHLETSNNKKIDLTICIADNSAVKEALNVSNLNVGHETVTSGTIKAYSDEKIHSIYNHHQGTYSFIDYDNNIAIFWTQSPAALPWWVCGSPLQRIFHCWMLKQNLQLTHAGAVASKQGAVLLLGKGGSGKSTTVLSCLEAGLFYISEDYCLISTEQTPYAYSLYSSAKIEQNTLNMFPHLMPHIFNTNRTPDEKALFFQQEICPNKIISGSPIKAILTLRVTPAAKTQLKPCASFQILTDLAISTIFQLANSNSDTLKRYTQLLKKVPCYRLQLGGDKNDAAKLIKELLR